MCCLRRESCWLESESEREPLRASESEKESENEREREGAREREERERGEEKAVGGCVVAHSNGVSTIKAFLCHANVSDATASSVGGVVATVALSGGVPHYDLVHALEKHQHH